MTSLLCISHIVEIVGQSSNLASFRFSKAYTLGWLIFFILMISYPQVALIILQDVCMANRSIMI